MHFFVKHVWGFLAQKIYFCISLGKISCEPAEEKLEFKKKILQKIFIVKKGSKDPIKNSYFIFYIDINKDTSLRTGLDLSV